jgi:geranylgeranyl pyrophosphate synthase
MQQRQARLEQALSDVIPIPKEITQSSNSLLEAMRYSTLNGGKRLRALLVYATGEALGSSLSSLDAAACAVELIHAYSLVHDDMPAMDNDDLRRGRATCHKAYDEATALLVGDALQSLAFEILSTQTAIEPQQQVRMIQTLANSAGAWGMVGGQAIDLGSVGKQLDLQQLQTMHELKTGALIQASVKLGSLTSSQIQNDTIEKLDQFAKYLGLAFQVQDDVLDVISDTDTLGKTQGADMALNKPTYPSLLGLEAAKQKATDLIDKTMAILEDLPYDTQALSALAQFVVQRSH